MVDLDKLYYALLNHYPYVNVELMRTNWSEWDDPPNGLARIILRVEVGNKEGWCKWVDYSKECLNTPLGEIIKDIINEDWD